MFFRLFFTVEYHGTENIPQAGPAVLAGNHPSYLDPILIYIIAQRPVRFLAWDQLFRIPVLGMIIRTFGAMPVNVKAADSNAFEQAMKVLQNGDLLGIFPEGGRSQRGIIESLKSGAARLAIFNQCPIIPITITGAYEAWPVWRPLPLPRKITVKFHEAIQLDPQECIQRNNDPLFFQEVTQRWREKVNQRLLPGLKAQETLNKLFARPASHLRIFELVPLGVLLICWFAPVNKVSLLLPVIGYYLYILLDILSFPQGRITKILRDLATLLLIVCWHHSIVKTVSLSTTEILSLLLVMIGLTIPYYWANYYDTQRFLRGVVLTYYLTMFWQLFYPATWGLHWSLTAFTAIYAIYRRTLFWYCQIVVVILYYIGLFLLWESEILNYGLHYLLLGGIINIYLRFLPFTAHDGRKV
jgi:1-acyl-sn-glycerol-3-phosphate acyltransferase